MLATEFLGYTLRNPLMLTEGPLSGTEELIGRAAASGAGLIFTDLDELGSAVASAVHDGKFDLKLWGSTGQGNLTPLWLLKYLPNMPASHIAIYNDFRGPNNSLTMREAAANGRVGNYVASSVTGQVSFVVPYKDKAAFEKVIVVPGRLVNVVT